MTVEFLSQIRLSKTQEELCHCIQSIIEAYDVYHFAKFLLDENVIALKQSESFAKFYNLLHLFSYGTYRFSIENRNLLPEMTDVMRWKLRQLTFLSLCASRRMIPIDVAIYELDLTQVEDLQRLFIDCIDDGLVKGLWDGERGFIFIKWWKNRDVADSELEPMQARIQSLIERCSYIKDFIIKTINGDERNSVKNSEKVDTEKN